MQNLTESPVKAALLRAGRFLHHNFLALLIGAYLLAGVFPGPGTVLRQISFGKVHWLDGSTLNFSPSMLMLSLLLFNAGLGAKHGEMKELLKKPAPLLAGFAVNLFLPLVFVLSTRQVLNLWHNPDELQNLLTGMALIAAMPVAGSSVAWSQNANGNLSLSLGLVFLSTILSPITTPLILHRFGSITTGDYAEDLNELAEQGANAFMWITVVIPSCLGIIARIFMGERRCEALKPYLKLVNLIMLLILNYSNGTTALPQVVRSPDLDLLVFICVCSIALCLTAFLGGWLLARACKCGTSDKAALMFGLGMNNNGTGLVLAASTLSDHWAVMLPMIFHTLSQQVIAAVIDRTMFVQDQPGDDQAGDDQPGDDQPLNNEPANHQSAKDQSKLEAAPPSRSLPQSSESTGRPNL